MGRGAQLFGLVVAAEARAEDQRRQMVSSLLERYDAARRTAPDQPLIEPPSGYSTAQRITTGYKAALFFVALEDVCGRENFRAALTNIVRALGGSEAGSEELRAAAEAASGRNLAEMFRTWIGHPGIPEDFRARYTSPPIAAGPSL
jgi:aminopeptidase N